MAGKQNYSYNSREDFDAQRQKLLSVVVPLYNEQENILPLLREIRKALAGYDYEIIAVDDGSSDRTVAMLREAMDERLSVVVFMRNFGQTSAMAAGIAQATGKYIATLDGDLQNDPGDIIRLLVHAMQGDWDVVAGYRQNRLDGWLLRKFPSRVANKIIRNLTGVYLRDYGCTLKIFKRQVAQSLGLYGELHRFIPVLANIIGARMTEMPVAHHRRLHGKSKYGLGRTTKVLGDLLLMVYMQRWMKKPMHFFGLIGGGFALAGIALMLFRMIYGLIWPTVDQTQTLAGMMLLIGGTIIVLMGFMAEMQMRSYHEASGKAPYLIRSVFKHRENALSEF